MTDKEKEAAKAAPKKEEKPEASAKVEAKKDEKPAAAASKSEKDNNKVDKKNTDTKAEKGKKGNKVSNFMNGVVNGIKGKFAESKKRKADAKKAKKIEKEKHPFVDKWNEPQNRSAYVHKVVQLDKKDNQFSESKFQKIHNLSSTKHMNDSLKRIGMCLNKKDLTKLPAKSADRVCFILINNYENDPECLDVGPLNDAYLFALIYHKLGYKIVYLFNPEMAKFTESLEFFLKNTSFSLTLFYTGRDSSSKVRNIQHGIQFNNHKEKLSSTDFGKFVGTNWNGKCKITIIHDCSCDGSIFSMKAAKNTVNGRDIEISAFSANKDNLKPKTKRLSQGLLTYYLCKLMRQFPNATPSEMANMLTISLERFKIGFTPLLSKESLNESPMFPDASAAFGGGSAPAPAQEQQQSDKPTAEPIPAEYQ